MPIGKLKLWNEERGFGFLRPEDGGSGDTFVHIAKFRAAGIPYPQVGDVYEFATKPTRDNRVEATDLALLHRVGE